ncbi:MAG: hypothetical protein GX591_10740 [Planctomycetes bacterium]|nr:hypothetical protein [Planctomycetota bacterium]
MKRCVQWTAVGVCVVTLATLWACAAPQPKVIPTEWELDIRYQAPQPIRVKIPGEDRVETFWYVLYTVTNHTGSDQVFVPQVMLFTDTGQVRLGSDGIYPSVFAAIKARHNNPYLEDLARISGRILQGEDNARDGVAIFRDFDPAARTVDVFVGGLSGETAVVQLPNKVLVTATDIRGRTTQELKDQIILHKTLQLTYEIPGEADARLTTPMRLARKDWVMR